MSGEVLRVRKALVLLGGMEGYDDTPTGEAR